MRDYINSTSSKKKIAPECLTFSESVLEVMTHLKQGKRPFELKTEYGKFIVKLEGVSTTTITHTYTEWKSVTPSKDIMYSLRDESITAMITIKRSFNPRIQAIIIVRALAEAFLHNISKYNFHVNADPLAAWWIKRNCKWADDYHVSDITRDYIDGLGDIGLSNKITSMRRMTLLESLLDEKFFSIFYSVNDVLRRVDNNVEFLENKMRKEEIWYPAGLKDFYRVAIGFGLESGYSASEVVTNIKQLAKFTGNLLPGQVVHEVLRPDLIKPKKDKEKDKKEDKEKKEAEKKGE